MKKIILAVMLAVLVAPVVASAYEVTAGNGNWQTISGQVSFAKSGDKLVVSVGGTDVYSVTASRTPVLMAGGEWIGYKIKGPVRYSVDVNIEGSVNVYLETDGVRTEVSI